MYNIYPKYLEKTTITNKQKPHGGPRIKNDQMPKHIFIPNPMVMHVLFLFLAPSMSNTVLGILQNIVNGLPMMKKQIKIITEYTAQKGIE
jgi:hypothetical protein